MLSEWFYYDESSPSCLRWAKDRVVGRDYKTVICAKDSPAGSKRPDGYWAVKLFNKTYKCHRIVFELKSGNKPTGYIDHIDGDTSNNLFSNLREVTHRVNCKNRGKFINNTSGVTGVHYYTNKVGNSYWIASWRDRGPCSQKCFSILKLGNDLAFKLACEYREQMIKEIGDYTERHKHD